MFPPQHIISWLNFLAGDSSGLAVNGSMSLLAARSFFLAKLWSHAHGELGGAYGRHEVLAHHPFLVTALQFELEIPHPMLGHGGHQCPMSPGAGRTSSHGGTFPCGVQGEMGVQDAAGMAFSPKTRHCASHPHPHTVAETYLLSNSLSDLRFCWG